MIRNKRPVNKRKIPPDVILIVTEGEKTEPLYFKRFPIHTTKVVKKVIGTGTNTLSLIRETDEEVQKAIDDYKQEYDIKLKAKDIVVWCVFDKDSFTASDFGNAINSARAKGYHVAYSNEAFELWYLLHDNYYDSAFSRDRYKSMLSSLLQFTYEKNNPNMYKILLGKQSDAIRNAKLLLSKYEPLNPNNDNPSTTVFELVEYLNRFIQYR